MSESLTHDEQMMLTAYRKAKASKFADISVSFEDGKPTKLWITEKTDPDYLKNVTRLREGAP